MDPLKQAFNKIKQDISELRQELIEIKQQLNTINQKNKQNNQQLTQNNNKITPLNTINQENNQLNTENPQLINKNNLNNTNNYQQIPNKPQQLPTMNQTNPTQTPTQPPYPTDNPTQTPTMNPSSQALKQPNIDVSIGNRGVPTDKQTDRQTNRQTDKTFQNNQFNTQLTNNDNNPNLYKEISDFERAKQILDSLDSVKKEIRLKFKRLTPQEMSVFSTLYNLQEQNFTEITYKLIANNLNLSESSIRDYINKLVNKGIPILKTRQNNKKITLSVAPNLEKIASLSTIIKLREL